MLTNVPLWPHYILSMDKPRANDELRRDLEEKRFIAMVVFFSKEDNFTFITTE